MNPPFDSAALEGSGRDFSAQAMVAQRVRPAELLALLYRQMRTLAGPRADIDDLVQSAAERALRALDRFEGRCSLPTFTYQIAYRTLIDQDRWYRRFRRRFVLESQEPQLDVPSFRCSETDLLELERARRLYRALDDLPPAKRAALILHDLEGLDVAEVSAITDTNERTVRSRLRDARKKLLELLGSDKLFEGEKP